MSASSVDPGDHDRIDPSWWASAVLDENGGRRAHWTVEELSFELMNLRAAAQVEVGEENLKTQVLEVLAKATSAMLVPDNWMQPYAPAMQLSGRRSFVPDDLSRPELELLARLVPLVEDTVLKTRIADVAWTYGNRGDQAMLGVAVDGYRSVPLERQAWLRGGQDSWRRALELMLRRGKAGRPVVEQMAAELADFVLADDGTSGFMLTDVSDLLGQTRSVQPSRARVLADKFVALATTAVGNHRLKRAYEREAATWFSRAQDQDLAHGCLVRVAQAYVDEADERLAEDNGALVAGTLVEQAIVTLRSLPRTYRSAHGLDERLQQLRERLADVRKRSLEEMQRIESDPVDITEYVKHARNAVGGKEPLKALASLATIAPLIDAAQAMADERKRLENSLARLFGSSTFSADGRKVATRTGLGVEEVSDEAVFAEVVRSFALRVSLTVDALILPAHEVLLLEHRFDFAFLTEICRESPVVPHGHTYLWARGLWHGLSGDFPSAISVLVPQVEQLVRVHLKDHKVFTLLVDDAGVETEKSLNALLEMEECAEVLGAGLTLELRALLCEQLGPNLRNDLAHGLLNDPQSWSSAAVYAWWLCLRMVLLPFCSLLAQAQSEPSTTDSPDE